MEITIRDEHLLLLKKVKWIFLSGEYGAPAIDPKKPYGNSDVESDIMDILKNLHCSTCGHELNFDKEECAKLHYELQYVLEIITQLNTFELGTYKKDINVQCLNSFVT